MDDSYARTLWTVIEPVHVVTYFSAECLQAHKDVGLKGFWMGYFGGRAAPMGAASAGVVDATFYVFEPERVRRAVPDAWSYASPEDILRSREAAAAAALRRHAPIVDEIAPKAVPLLRRVAEAADAPGRPLFCANRDLPVPDDDVAALWLATTVLREHRGEGHLMLLTAEGLDGPEASVLSLAVAGDSIDKLTVTRGWSAERLRAAVAALAGRGLLNADGTATEEGRVFRRRIEERTDALAAPPYRVLDEPEELFALLEPVARAVAASGDVPFPNPIGLPRP
ncbi:SCO6745 family protein [Actinomadura rugatobispora]|uniref:MarR family transcriptional regulator n=1 Tax=Actinomadura rugatobispora TaxID=1994 RepID=A0ABW1AFZ7_9ACTN